MKAILYLSTIFLTAGLFIACNNNVSTGDTQATEKNPTIQEPKPGDIDGDGVLDEDDNCPTLANTDQADGNSDGVGDVCEDLECASNFCEDHAFLSDRHCDGDVSVGCSAQSDGCLVETSRMNCSEGCRSEGDLMGECKPKPRDLTDPLIIEATGTMTHGSTITMTGEDFGEHDLNIEWTGSKIENATTGRDPAAVFGSDWGYHQNPNGEGIIHITDTKSWSGNKSIDASLDQVEDFGGGISAVRLGYAIPQLNDWKKLFVSYWYRVEEPGEQIDGLAAKHLWISPRENGPYGTPPNGFLFGGNVNEVSGLVERWTTVPSAWYYCDQSLLGGVYPMAYGYKDAEAIGYQITSDLNSRRFIHRGSGPEQKVFSYSEGSWARVDHYLDLGSPDTATGEVYSSTLYPNGQGTQYGFNPGLHIGMWYKNVRAVRSNIPECPDYAYPNLVGFYLFVDNYENNAAADMWLDDIYIQIGTRARMVIGNSPNYEEATLQEIQYPTAWSDTEIKFQLNYGGSFKSGDTAYLYVITDREYDTGNRDAYGNGHYNIVGVSDGYPITLE